MIVLFIASTTQAMASVVMPYQMNMNDQVVASQNHCLTMNVDQMTADLEQDQQMSCSEEHDCCSGICSLSYISSSGLLSGTKPVHEPVQGIENSIIATTNTLYRPPILG